MKGAVIPWSSLVTDILRYFGAAQKLFGSNTVWIWWMMDTFKYAAYPSLLLNRCFLLRGAQCGNETLAKQLATTTHHLIVSRNLPMCQWEIFVAVVCFGAMIGLAQKQIQLLPRSLIGFCVTKNFSAAGNIMWSDKCHRPQQALWAVTRWKWFPVCGISSGHKDSAVCRLIR